MHHEKPDHTNPLRKSANWRQLHFYHKADTLHQLTYAFCKRFLPAHGDRTVDQMIQAARSGKQNIVEGSEDGKTSTEMELKLLNVARSSLQELREDYEDYAKTRQLHIWTPQHPRYHALLHFCRTHNHFNAYAPYTQKWNSEEFCNAAITLCRMTDRMMCSYLARLETHFIKEGGIKERMHAARTAYRHAQEQELQALKTENDTLKAELKKLKALLEEMKGNR